MTSFHKAPTLVTASETRTSDGILVHGPEDYEGMRRAGRLAADTLDFITPHIVPGVTTAELDRLCDGFIHDHGASRRPTAIAAFRNRSARRSTTWSATAFRATSACGKAMS